MNNKRKVVVIEDEVLISEFIDAYLRKLGYDVKIFNSGDFDFKAFFKKEKPYLALLDINLNGEVSGIDIAESCHQLNIPFLYISSYSDSVTVKQALKHDPMAYVLKPFNENDLRINLNLVEAKVNTNIQNGQRFFIKEGYNVHRLKY